MLRQTDCVICGNPNGLPTGIIIELATCWVTAEKNGALPGYVCIVAKTHVSEPFQLPDGERQLFFAECMIVAKALNTLLAPRKLNYEIHGNTIPHLHLHLYPRYEGDPYEGGPIDHHATFQRSPAQLERIALAIRAETESSQVGCAPGRLS